MSHGSSYAVAWVVVLLAPAVAHAQTNVQLWGNLTFNRAASER
jgi:hypothetical protein